MKLIQYVGTKSSKADTVARTGLLWGPGQVHAVTDEAARKLLAHPSVWQEVPPKDITDEKANPETHAEAQAETQAGRRTRLLKAVA